jgi:predicted ATPase
LNTLQEASAPRQARRASMSETTIIKFEGLKGVGSVELNLRADQKVYAFIGTNGVGKTKVLEALFKEFFFTNKDVAHRITSLIEIGDFDLLKKLKLTSEPKHSMPVVMVGTYSRLATGSFQINDLGSPDVRKDLYFKQVGLAIQQEKMAYLGGIEDLSSWFVSRAKSDNQWQSKDDNRGIEIVALLNLLNRIDSKFDATFMQSNGDGVVKLKINDLETEIGHLSSGFIALLKIVQTIIAGYANFTNERNLTDVKGIVLIDEIESHLHIEWQSKIIPLLKELFPNTTFYVATHSALVLTQLQQGEAYLLKRDEADGVVRSEMIKNPGGKLFHDVLNEAFSVDLNALKRKKMDENAQLEGKKLLLELLDEVNQD